MNRKDKSNKTGKGGAEQMRFVCDNWDKPTVRVKSHGKGHLPARKVVTRGVIRVDASVLLESVRATLRSGYEVRLVRDGNDAVRFIPMMDKESDTMLVNARAMGSFRDCTLADKKARYIQYGSEVSYEEVQSFTEMKKAEIPDRGGDIKSVTPDTIVKCPKCGYSFRVGRRLAA